MAYVCAVLAWSATVCRSEEPDGYLLSSLLLPAEVTASATVTTRDTAPSPPRLYPMTRRATLPEAGGCSRAAGWAADPASAEVEGAADGCAASSSSVTCQRVTTALAPTLNFGCRQGFIPGARICSE